MGNCTRKCSACKYRKWRGDYSLFICEISGRVIEPYYYCDIPNEIYDSYKEGDDKCLKKNSIH